jgi:hypothetical protein
VRAAVLATVRVPTVVADVRHDLVRDLRARGGGARARGGGEGA